MLSLALAAATCGALLHPTGRLPPTPGRSTAVRCCADERLPESATAAIPPNQLADAWQREEKAKKLGEILKGCSLYVVGLGQRKVMVSQVLARRLPRYRCYDVSSIMCSTYATLAGGDAAVPTLSELVTAEPLADVEQLSRAVTRELQQMTRSVFVAWDGAVAQSDYMVMQQGIVVHLDFETPTDAIALPSDGTAETLERWREGHLKADVSLQLSSDTPADDAAFEIIDKLVAFIEANPAKSDEWKSTADTKLAQKDAAAD